MAPDITQMLNYELKKELADRYFGFRKLIEEEQLRRVLMDKEEVVGVVTGPRASRRGVGLVELETELVDGVQGSALDEEADIVEPFEEGAHLGHRTASVPLLGF